MLNNMGINPFEWFQSEKKDPPSAFDWEDTAPSEYEPPDDNRWASPEKMKELESNPRPEEKVADWFDESDQEKNYASRHESTPEFEKTAEEVVTMHEKMYRIATAKYNPFAIGGSESLGGGSEKINGT
tara:strand:+ start:542 stop:925 length:384 start_codon:yes stop_codon:yes gene_type:complete